jgi:hypothetical protein
VNLYSNKNEINVRMVDNRTTKHSVKLKLRSGCISNKYEGILFR